MLFKQYLEKLFLKLSLSRAEAHDMLVQMGTGQANNAQLAAFMTVFLMRAITPEELAGFRMAMLDLCQHVELDGTPAMDVCGTGGDGKDTFNISTTAAFVIAGAGQPVAKHGNYGVSSTCGSSTVMETMGYVFTNNQDVIQRQLEQANITFLHAPMFHPAMRRVAPVRQELGTKTFFNMLGPLVNPARPPKQLAGVFNLDLARLYTYLLQETEVDFGVVHALDGYDEISLTGPAKYLNRGAEKVLVPEDFGHAAIDPELLHAAQLPNHNALRLIGILKGEINGHDRAVVCANAAIALFTSGKAQSIEEGIAQAQQSIDSGAAYKSLTTLLDIQ